MSSDLIVVLVTTPDETSARNIAALLVENRLVGCAQVEGPISSIYRWKEKIEQDEEWRLVLKTSLSVYDELEAKIKEEHPYDTPQIMALPVRKSSYDYASWLNSQIK